MKYGRIEGDHVVRQAKFWGPGEWLRGPAKSDCYPLEPRHAVQVEAGKSYRWYRTHAELSGAPWNDHRGLFIELVWGSVVRDRVQVSDESYHDFLVSHPDVAAIPRFLPGSTVAQHPEVPEHLRATIAGEWLEDFYVGYAQMLRVGDVMRYHGVDQVVTEEDIRQRRHCAFSRGYLPRFWGLEP